MQYLGLQWGRVGTATAPEGLSFRRGLQSWQSHTHFSAIGLEKTVEDGPGAWVPVTHQGDGKKHPAGFALTQAHS